MGRPYGKCRVEDVMDVTASRFQPPPHTIAPPFKGIVSGIVSHGDHTITVLDMDALFEEYRAGLR